MSLQQRIEDTVAATLLVVGVVVAVVAWPSDPASAPPYAQEGSLDQPVTWVRENLTGDERLLVDWALWGRLVNAGYPERNLVGHGAEGGPCADTSGTGQVDRPDTGSAATSDPPGCDQPTAPEAMSARSVDYVVSTPSLRRSSRPSVELALDASTVVEHFGSGDQLVEIRRVLPREEEQLAEAPPDPAASPSGTPAVDDAEERARAEAGAALLGNDRLSFAPEAEAAVATGRLDERLFVLLAGASSRHTLDIAIPPGSPDSEDRVVRAVQVTAVDGRDARGRAAIVDLLAYLSAQRPPYAPQTVIAGLDGVTIGFTDSSAPPLTSAAGATPSATDTLND